MSRERVRQIEVRAFEKVQEAVKRNIASRELPRTGHRGPLIGPARRALPRTDRPA